MKKKILWIKLIHFLVTNVKSIKLKIYLEQIKK